MGMSRSRGLVAVASTALLVLAALPADADGPPPAYVESDFETANLDLHCDGGVSVPLAAPFAGKSLWLFGDTFVSDAAGAPAWGNWSFLPGTFAAIGNATAGSVPTVREVPTPGTGAISATPPSPALGPAHFLPPFPPDIRLPGNTGACGAAGSDTYSANWALGATRGPSTAMTLYDNGTTPVAVTATDAAKLVFVSYFGVCVDPTLGWLDGGIRIQRFSMAAYDPATNTFKARWNVFDANVPTPTGNVLPWQQALWHPQFSGGYMYTYASSCTDFNDVFAACTSGPVVVARAPVAGIHDRTAYRYWKNVNPGNVDDPANWSTNGADAVSVIPTTGGGPLQLHVGNFAATGDGYLMMEQTSMGAHYRLYQSSTPVGPWTFVRSAQAPNCNATAGAGCYALVGHPEISTPSQLLYSYADMADNELETVALPGVP